MTLRVKVYLSIAFLALTMLVVVSLVARTAILRSFETLQNQQALSQLRRANTTLENEKYVLDEFLRPVSSWDLSYEYVARQNPDFEELVYTDNGFFADSYPVNYYLILDVAGNRIAPLSSAADSVDLSVFPQELDAILMERLDAVEDTSEPLLCDLVVLEGAVFLVAARALLNSDEDQPPRGLVAMTIPMNETTLSYISDYNSLGIDFQPLTNDNPYTGNSTAPAVSYDEASSTLSATQLLLDYRGDPVAWLTTVVQDDIVATASAAFRTVVSILILLSVLLSLSGVVIFEVMVMRRIARLNTNIEALGTGKDAGVLVEGTDEVSVLSKKIQEMVLRLQIAENERIQSERLRVSAELAAGVSHNLNNMLHGIIGPAELLADKLTEENQKELLALIRRSSGRASRLVSQLNQVVQPKSNRSENPIDLNEVVKEAIVIAQPRWRDEAAANGAWIDLKQELGHVSFLYGNQGLLVDVVLNLLFNAIDALPQGGTITIRSFNVNDQVCLTVADTGEGMSEDVQLRVFEPFFTTKLTVGTGLGLATVKTTVDNWGGSISLSSALGEGSEFTVMLPAYEGMGRAPSPAKSLKARTDLQVLLVDDDEAVRQAMRLMLPDYCVTVAASGKEAVDLLEQQEFDVALIDLGIPDLSGDEVARYAKQQQAGITNILITGWYLEADDPRCKYFDRVMVKPIESSAALVTAIEETLGYDMAD